MASIHIYFLYFAFVQIEKCAILIEVWALASALFPCITEEDIIVLQGVQGQMEKFDVDQSRPWQTEWPQHSNTNTGTGQSVNWLPKTHNEYELTS